MAEQILLNPVRDSKDKEKAQREQISNGIKKTYKYRLYPTSSQQNILEKHLSLCRWLYNHFLEERRTLYEKKKTRITCYDQIKEIPTLKKEKPELREVYSQTLQDVVRRLDKAFQNFFQRVKENKQGKKQKPGYPRFKGYWRYDSFVYPQSGFQLRDNKLNLSKIGSLKIKLHREIKGDIKTLTIRRTNTNKWYACFAVQINQALPEKREIKQTIGLDVGLTSFLTTHTGKKLDNPRYLTKSEQKLSKIQRWHSRKKLRSKNRSKSRLKIARLHEKITNQRQDFLHKLSNKLVKNFQLIAFEKLNIKGMKRNKYLAKSIIDVSWARFLQQLIYKAAEAGIWAVGVNPQYTTQVCSGCNTLVKKTLATKRHKCSRCGLIINRDVNAARNILRLALQAISPQKSLEIPTTVGTTGSNACGVGGLLST
jgi:putative transposase